MEPFRCRTGSAYSGFFSGELAEAGRFALEFIRSTIEKYSLRIEDGYHVETRAISLANVNINDSTNGHFSDNEITQILEKDGEVVAFAYISRDDRNCAEVITVDLIGKQ